MKATFIETANVGRFNRAIDTLLAAGEGEPRLGLVTGQIGLGKSWAVDAAYINRNLLYVRAYSRWTAGGMYKTILKKAGLAPTTAVVDNLERCADMLKARQGGPDASGVLVIDEADYLLSGSAYGRPGQLMDALRDLYDTALTPILLVGEPELAETLEHNAKNSTKWARFHQRILVEERFLPAGPAEVKLLAERATGLSMPDETAQDLCAKLGGNLRLIIICLRAAQRMAAGNRVTELSPKLMEAARAKADKTRRYFAQGDRKVA